MIKDQEMKLVNFMNRNEALQGKLNKIAFERKGIKKE
jgi:hypothetical protein